MSNKPSYWKVVMDGEKYISSLHAIPPTFNNGDVGGFAQFTPDPYSREMTTHLLNESEKAKQQYEETYRKWRN